MKKEHQKKFFTPQNQKEFKKSKLNSLTYENDLLVKNLKKPGDLFRAAYSWFVGFYHNLNFS